VIRRRPGEVHGVVVQLRLTEQDRAFAVEVGDPIAQAALDHVQRRAPLRNGSAPAARALLGRP